MICCWERTNIIMRLKFAAKRIAAFLCSVSFMTAASSVFAQGAIPDHKGTSMEQVAVGTASLNSLVKSYSDLFEKYGAQYGVDPNLLAAICMQESSGRNLSYRDDGSEYPAWGIMQIEYSLEKAFAKFGLDNTGVAWTLQDRLDPEKSIQFAAYLISDSLFKYDCDYMKMIQSYNFGQTVLNRIIAAKGDAWMDERKNAAEYADNWAYKTYGDAQYIEHVLRYYHNDINYIGAKVRVNGKLVQFEDQYPLILEDFTLVPIRGVSETLGAKVTWDHDNYSVIIEKDNSTIILPVNADYAYIDGKQFALEKSAEIINDRTMIPIRFVAEHFDIGVDWDQDTRTVLITK